MLSLEVKNIHHRREILKLPHLVTLRKLCSAWKSGLQHLCFPHKHGLAVNAERFAYRSAFAKEKTHLTSLFLVIPGVIPLLSQSVAFASGLCSAFISHCMPFFTATFFLNAIAANLLRPSFSCKAMLCSVFDMFHLWGSHHITTHLVYGLWEPLGQKVPEVPLTNIWRFF